MRIAEVDNYTVGLRKVNPFGSFTVHRDVRRYLRLFGRWI